MKCDIAYKSIRTTEQMHSMTFLYCQHHGLSITVIVISIKNIESLMHEATDACLTKFDAH